MPKQPSWPDAERLGALTIAARLEEVRKLSGLLSGVAAREGFDPLTVIDLELAMVEAANNIVIHGYGGESELELEVQILRQSDLVAIELRDAGEPIPANLLNNPPLQVSEGECGRGLAIIGSCVDRVEYESSGGLNRLRLVKALTAPAV